MPVEVKAHTYLYEGRYWGSPMPPLKKPRLETPSDAQQDGTSNAYTSEDSFKMYRGPFRYNPLHDLESLWWIAAYFLMSRKLVFEDATEPEVPRDGDEGESEEDDQLASLHTLFSDAAGRSWAMCTEGGFSRHLDCLHPFMRDMALALNDARDTLVQGYHYLEKDIDNRSFAVRMETYDGMSEMYSFIAEAMEIEAVKTERLMGW